MMLVSDDAEVGEFAVRTRNVRAVGVNNSQLLGLEMIQSLDPVKTRNRRNKTSKSTITKYIRCQ